MSDKAHSDYGGSVAEKWLNCPGYADAVKDLKPSPPTIHTVGGSAQHALNERVTATGCRPEAFVGKPWSSVYTDCPPEFAKEEYDEGNVERCRIWIDTIHKHFDPLEFRLDFEEKVVLSSISPELYGSADLIAIDIPNKILAVPDYKDGSGKIVDVTTSPQPPFYAVGADDTYGLGVDKSWTIISMIVQPKAPEPVTFHKADGNSVIEWRGVFRRAWERSKVDQTRVAGEHCHWCRAAGTCKALAESKRLSIRADFNGPVSPNALTPEQVANILRVAPEVENWLEEVRKHALQSALAGKIPPGYKLAEGRAGARKWGDEAHAKEVLCKALGERAYEKKLLTPAKAETVLGKVPFNCLNLPVVQSAGSPCLALAGSEREEYSRQKAARSDFTT